MIEQEIKDIFNKETTRKYEIKFGTKEIPPGWYIELDDIIQALNKCISFLSQHYIPKRSIHKAIEILGKPVMSYAPEIAVKEYDAKIKEAVGLLLEKGEIK